MRSSTTSYPSPAAGHSSITRSPLWPLCVLLVLNRVRSSPDPSQRRTSVEQRQGASRRATRLPPCSACVRLHVLRFTRPTLTCRPQDLQLDLSFRVALTSKRLGYMEHYGAFITLRSCGRMPTLKCARPDKCCSYLPSSTCVFQYLFGRYRYLSLCL
jgi:hypothetical protein